MENKFCDTGLLPASSSVQSSLSSTGNEFSTQYDHEKIESQATPPHCFNLCQCAERSPGSSVWGHSKGYPGCHHEPFLNQFSFPLFRVPSILDMVLKTLNGNNRSSFTFNEAGYTAPSRLDRGSDERGHWSQMCLGRSGKEYLNENL